MAMKKYGYKAPTALYDKVQAKAESEFRTVASVIVEGLVEYVKDWPDSGTEVPEPRDVERVT